MVILTIDGKTFSLLQMIGKGQYSTVFKVLNTKTGKEEVLKLIQTCRKKIWQQELQILTTLSSTSPYFLKPSFSGQIPNPWKNTPEITIPWIKTSKHFLYSVYPLQKTVLNHQSHFTYPIRCLLFLQMIHGLEQLSKKKMMHNDIHFDNILWNQENSKPFTVLYGHSIPTQNYQFYLIDFDQSTTSSWRPHEDLLHLVFTMTNKDQILKQGGFLTPSQWIQKIPKWTPTTYQKIIDQLPCTFPPLFPILTLLRNSESIHKHNKHHIYISLLMVEIVYTCLYRKKDCKERGVPYTPLFLNAEDVLFSLRNFNKPKQIVSFFSKKI